MTVINICAGVPSVDPERSYQAAAGEDRANTGSTGTRSKRSIGAHTKFWAQHRTIDVAFLSSDLEFIEFAKEEISDWLPHINLTIRFVEGTKGDIRISDSSELMGHWSYFGTDALTVPEDEPTLHIDTTDQLLPLHVVMLHEFGHALGLHHEHQHPDANIDWNTPKVYAAFERPWLSKEAIYDNIFKKLERTEVRTGEYDKKSIMHYHFPAELIWDGTEYPLNKKLSEKDISFISSIYPRNTTPVAS
ncbi:matrixin family metalloprotease [Pseudomonas frederiksbergensis]|nr:matrixin family metalloprotease [Pseudomonas frederiksbergensis]